MKWAWSMCALALTLDTGIFSLMPGFSPSTAELVAFAMAHVTACLLFSIALISLLPEKLRQPVFVSGLFIFTSIIFIPVLGMIGLLTCVLPALFRPGLSARLHEWQHPRMLRLPTEPVEPRTKGIILRPGELAGILRHAADAKKRTDALIATLWLEKQQSVPLWRLALKDPNDEVRLLAFALLNRQEKVIEARMRERYSQAGGSALDQVFLKHKALANDFWELAYLGTPHESTLVSLCGRAHEHVQAALQLRPNDGGLQFLLGRILLTKKELDAASEAFENARRCGIDVRQSAPFLAEIAFLKGCHADVKHHLTLAGNSRIQLSLKKVSTYWKGVNREPVER